MAMSEISRTARDLILNTLEERGLSDRSCLVACGINPTFFTDWRTENIGNPAFDKLYKIFKHLDLSMDEMAPVIPPARVPEDEAELLRIYQMMPHEGKSMIMAAAYAEKRRLSEQGSRKNAEADIG